MNIWSNDDGMMKIDGINISLTISDFFFQLNEIPQHMFSSVKH